ncbi:MoaD/ThiS family protein [Sinosporangium album]|nr:MoaD/ThiS family protein [Sinosporangium album]
MPTVTIRYWAAAKSAAGVAEETRKAATLDELLSAISAGRDELARVVKLSSFVIDGAPVGVRDRGAVRLSEGAVVEVLPPYAGG